MDAKAVQELKNLSTFINDFKHPDRPWITLSFGMSLDGKIATRKGDSKYISGEQTRNFVHELRHLHDAILVGISTVQLDHPLLTTRRNHGENKDGHRIVLDSSLRISLREPILNHKSKSKTIVVAKRSLASIKKIHILEKKGVHVWLDPSQAKGIQLPWLMRQMKAFGIDSLLVEGGGTIHESFIRHALMNVIYAQISPILIGGETAKTPVEGLGIAFLKEATRIAYSNYFPSGRDIIIVAKKEE